MVIGRLSEEYRMAPPDTMDLLYRIFEVELHKFDGYKNFTKVGRLPLIKIMPGKISLDYKFN